MEKNKKVKYYIYHIPGVKIGVSQNPHHRVKVMQKAVKWEILEEHTDINLVSEREIELQQQYGYKVDKVPYYKSMQSWHNPLSRQKRIENTDYKQRVANADWEKKVANTDYKAIMAKIDWKASRAKIDYSKYNMAQCHTPEANAKKSKSVKQYDLEGNFIKLWSSMNDARKSLNIKSTACIWAACNKKQKTAHNFIWKYA